MNRRAFLKGVALTAGGILAPEAVAAEPERRIWAFPRNPVAVPLATFVNRVQFGDYVREDDPLLHAFWLENSEAMGVWEARWSWTDPAFEWSPAHIVIGGVSYPATVEPIRRPAYRILRYSEPVLPSP